jgi:hypothetical protein
VSAVSGSVREEVQQLPAENLRRPVSRCVSLAFPRAPLACSVNFAFHSVSAVQTLR